MDQDSAHMVAASKVPMLKLGEFELWRMRIKQYIEMIDYALWEVIENRATLPKTQVVKGVTIVWPITSAEDKAQIRLEVKARSTLMMGIPNEHQLKFNSIKDAKLLLEAMLDQTFDRLQKLVIKLELLDEKLSQEDVNQKLLRSLSPEWNTHAVVWRNKAELETMSMDDLYNNLKVYEPEVKGMSSSSLSTQNMAFVSSSNNNTSSSNEAVNAAYGVTTASTQVNTAYSTNIDNMSDVVICSFFASQPNSPQLAHKDLQQIYPDDIEEMDLRWQMAILTMRARRALRNQNNKNKESSRRSMLVETSTSTAFVSCDGVGGYNWSDQAKEGPNYALMAYSSSSSDSEGNPQIDLQDQRVIDSGCSRHMTGKMSYLTDYEEINGGYVAFGGNPKRGKITRKCTIKTATNDETSGILKSFITGIENLVDHKVKVIRCLVTILNTIDHLGKFDGKADEGFFVGYSFNSKAFRVFNNRTRIVEENLHIRFSENIPNVVGNGPDWLFDIDELTRIMNYEPIVLGTQSNGFAGTKASDNAGQARNETEPIPRVLMMMDPNLQVMMKKSAAGTKEVNVVGGKTSIGLPFDPNMPVLEDYSIFDSSRDDEDDGAKANMNNLDTTIQVSPIPTTRIHKDHPLDQVIRDLQSAKQTRHMSKKLEEHGFEEPKKVIHALKDPIWIEAMQEELLQFKIEAVRLFLAYASFKDFMVYQMDVKSDFLYGKIKEEVYVCKPPGFEDLDFPDRVYKVEKALYGLHQALRAWYETLSTYLLDNRFQRGKIDKTLFIKSSMGELTFFLGLQVQLKKDGIFISQDKYVVEILKKFGFTEVKTTSTPMETQKPLLKDEDGEEVDVHMYRSMIVSLMYLTSSRPDIMFAVCACARYQVNSKVSHLHAVKRIFRYLKGQPKLGLWYPKDSPFDLVAYTNSDYARASLDRKSTTGGLHPHRIEENLNKRNVRGEWIIEREMAMISKDGTISKFPEYHSSEEEEPTEQPRSLNNNYGVTCKEEEKGAILELKRRHLKNIIFCTYTPYPVRKIRRISAISTQEMRND
ncbi:putative ribonuclease H-like domain-containing protein [Tanacetum coccineum]